MFDQNIKRIGWACKFLHPNQNQKPKDLKLIQQPLNTRSTTVRWLNNQSRDVAEQRLWELMEHNINAFEELIKYAGSLPENLRMVRLSSDCLPVYTEPTWRYYWRLPDVERYLASNFARVGETARGLDVRISFHPGQYTVLASDNPDIVDRSIEEFEYHVDMARWMGYGKQFQDFKINVHVSGRRKAEGILETLTRLTPEARNCITFENDEYSAGLDEIVKLADHAALVLDIHHHYINTCGEYITPDDERFKRVIDSWRGVRPVIHYSLSREELIGHLDTFVRPDLETLLEQGYKRAKLRAHSDYMWNDACNDWALSFWEYSDIMVESKFKNLASIDLYNYAMNTQRDSESPRCVLLEAV